MLTEELLRAYFDSRREIRGDLSPKTIRGYIDSARFAAKYWPPVDERVASSLQALRRLSIESERTHLRRLRTIGRFAEKRFGLPNPYVAVQPRRAKTGPKRIFTPAEYARLHDACRDTIDIALLDLLFGTGIRIGEVPLSTDQVGMTHILVSGKTGPRYAAITLRDRGLLLSTAVNGRLWAIKSPFRPRVGPLSPAGLRTNWRRLAARAGIKGPKNGPHTARRTFASEYLMNGGSIEALKHLLGHTSIRTTELYARGTPGWVARQLSRVDPLGRIQTLAQISGPAQVAPEPALLQQERSPHATAG